MARAMQKPEGRADGGDDAQATRASAQLQGAANFWHSPTFEELAAAQGVRPVERLEDIMGGWPDDQLNDGFEEAIRAMRQEDLRGERGR